MLTAPSPAAQYLLRQDSRRPRGGKQTGAGFVPAPVCELYYHQASAACLRFRYVSGS